MKRLLINYDLKGKDSNDYRRLINKIEELGGNKVQYSSWYLITDMEYNEVYRILSGYVDNNDSLTVVEVTNEIRSKMSQLTRITCMTCERFYYEKK